MGSSQAQLLDQIGHRPVIIGTSDELADLLDALGGVGWTGGNVGLPQHRLIVKVVADTNQRPFFQPGGGQGLPNPYSLADGVVHHFQIAGAGLSASHQFRAGQGSYLML